MAYEEKVENIACYIKNLDSDIKGLKAEEDSLEARRKIKEKKVAYLRRLLSDNMDGQKLETARCSVSFRSSESVVVEDEEKIPESFMVKTTTKKPDKKAIKAAIKAGVCVPGCLLINNLNLQLK